jgi:hypothetical protein
MAPTVKSCLGCGSDAMRLAQKHETHVSHRSTNRTRAQHIHHIRLRSSQGGGSAVWPTGVVAIGTTEGCIALAGDHSAMSSVSGATTRRLAQLFVQLARPPQHLVVCRQALSSSSSSSLSSSHSSGTHNGGSNDIQGGRATCTLHHQPLTLP